MTRRLLALLLAFTAGTIVGHVSIPSVVSSMGARFAPRVVLAQAHKPLMITHLYTGPDNQTHAEEIEMKFTPGSPGEPISSASIGRRAAALTIGIARRAGST